MTVKTSIKAWISWQILFPDEGFLSRYEEYRSYKTPIDKIRHLTWKIILSLHVPQNLSDWSKSIFVKLYIVPNIIVGEGVKSFLISDSKSIRCVGRFPWLLVLQRVSVCGTVVKEGTDERTRYSQSLCL